MNTVTARGCIAVHRFYSLAILLTFTASAQQPQVLVTLSKSRRPRELSAGIAEDRPARRIGLDSVNADGEIDFSRLDRLGSRNVLGCARGRTGPVQAAVHSFIS
jgi:hypothetical protein